MNSCGTCLVGFLLLTVSSGVKAAEDDSCLHDASRRFRVPASLIRAIMDVEGGTEGRVSYNTNGSYDIGPMQINSIWLADVEKRGGSLQLLLRHRCANIHFGTWLLSRELGGIDPLRIDTSSFWRAVGNYHSRTPERNAAYSQKVWLAWRKRLMVASFRSSLPTTTAPHDQGK